MDRRTRTVLFVLLAALITIGVLAARSRRASPPTAEQPTVNTEIERRVAAPRTAIIAEGLEVPWGLVFLSDGSLLVTERPGRVRLINTEAGGAPIFVANIAGVKAVGEGGLLGITLHPDFEQNHLVYLYYTYASEGDRTLNRVARFRFENNTLVDERTVADAIPGAVNHNGGRIKFGPDRYLYITTGDAQNSSLAQDRSSLAGKILRVTDDGSPAPGNPFDNRVYSYGHRNPQGLAWDSAGQLWATEHGPLARDELNRIEAGANYGWPIITGDAERSGMRTPILQSGFSTWAPAGAAFSGETLYFGGLRGNALFAATVRNREVRLKEYARGEFGRIRDVVVGPDGFLYLTTSNRDGRGTPQAGDDKIVKVDPVQL